MGLSSLHTYIWSYLVFSGACVTIFLLFRWSFRSLLCCFSVQILHSAVGLVKSNPMLTGFQVFSRVFLLWGVVWSVPEVGSVCKCVYVYPSAHAHMYVCVCVCVCIVYTWTCKCVCVYPSMCVWVHVHAWMCTACACICTHACSQEYVFVMCSFSVFFIFFIFYVLFPQHCRCQTTFQL